MKQFKLCYVYNNWAYFTTQDLDKQWGDDWNDAPYEHNAGTPYEYGTFEREKELPSWEIRKVAFDGSLETPADYCGSNSPYSVEMINSGAVAWLVDRYGDSKTSVPAGTTLTDFIELVAQAGGSVYFAI